jgi:hypothetical protein
MIIAKPRAAGSPLCTREPAFRLIRMIQCTPPSSPSQQRPGSIPAMGTSLHPCGRIFDADIGAQTFIRMCQGNAPLLAFPAEAGIHFRHGRRPSSM